MSKIQQSAAKKSDALHRFKSFMRDLVWLIPRPTAPRLNHRRKNYFPRHEEACKRCGQPMQVGEGQVANYHGPANGNCRQLQRHPSLNSFC